MSDFNIVVAHFGHHNRVVMTDTLYQYDYGQKLKVEGITALPQTFQAHFSNVQHGGVSITVTGINGMVDVPNSLLMTGKRIYCWIYVTETGSGETVYQILMPVQSRPMPEYYDVEDVGVFDSVVNQVAGYAATATTGATSATASATAAAESETAAAASASAAAGSAENAAASEDNAEASASAAQASDASAATAATTATTKAAQAAQSATSAGSAADRAEAAQEAAETAQEAAETAATSATADAATATAKATAAAASATTASAKATDAINAATTATAQAVAAESAKTTAVEAKTAAQTAQSAAETAATTATAKATEAAASATAAAQAAASINTPDSALSESSTNAVQNKIITGEITDVKSAIDALKIVDTASGAIASFPDGAAMPAESLTVELEPIQEGTGNPSPDNIRPISGRDSVTVMRTGENLFPYKDVETQTKNGVTITIEKSNGAITNIHMQGTATSAFSFSFSSRTDIWTLFKGTYNMYIGGDKPTMSKTFDINIRKIGESQDISTESNVLTISLTEDTDFGSSYIWVYSGAVLNHNIVPVIVRSGIDTSVKYPITQRQSMNIALGQTVYGGKVDVTGGSMESTYGMVDMGTLTWLKSDSLNLFYAVINPDPKKFFNAICSSYPFVGAYTNLTDKSCAYVYNNRIAVRDSAYSTAADFKTAMSGVMLCYELETPVIIETTPVEMSTLKGQNNVWSNADSVTVDYVADPKLYIARLTEPDADMVADANITSGKYFMVGNTLYIATANIASGGTISPGVNCTRTNLASALNAINA